MIKTAMSLAFVLFTSILVQAEPLMPTDNRLVIICDERSAEKPHGEEENNEHSGLTEVLDYFIREDCAPILVSPSVLHNLAVIKNNAGDVLPPLMLHEIFNEKNEKMSYFLILSEELYYSYDPIYQKNKKTYNREIALSCMLGLNVKRLKQENLSNNASSDLLTYLHNNHDTIYNNKPGMASGFLHDLFLKEEDVSSYKNGKTLLRPWSIMLFGHGDNKGIDSMTLAELRDLFNFFNTQQTKVVTITACQIGGIAKDIICQDQFGNSIKYNFDFLVGGLTDNSIALRCDKKDIAKKLFDTYSKQNVNTQEATRLFSLLHAVNEHFPSKAQIRKKGTNTFTPEKSSLTQLTPIKMNTFNNPNFVKHTPIFLEKAALVKALCNKRTVITQPTFFSKVISNSSILPLNLAISGQNFTEEYYPTNYRFPCLISMQHHEDPNKPSIHKFSEMKALNIVNGLESPFFGVLRFISDTFLYNVGQESQNIFCIDKLTGYNDISLLPENVKPNKKEDLRLKKLLEKNQLVGKKITLTKVIISRFFAPEKNALAYCVAFSINDKKGHETSWSSVIFIEAFNSAEKIEWDFLKINTKGHIENFNRYASQVDEPKNPPYII